MHIETFPVGPLGCNCSIVADLATKHALVIDPGGDFSEIRTRLEKLDVIVDAIVHTHTHIDHVGATAPLQKLTHASAKIHEADRFLYDLLPVQAKLIGLPLPERAEMEGDLLDGTTLRIGVLEIGVLHTPGHTPGSVSFVLSHAGDTRLFAGDTLFRRSIGRTDLWGGDSTLIMRSLREKLLTLPQETTVVTGHGPTTTIGEERTLNPFLAQR